MPIRRMSRAFFRSIGWNIAALLAIVILSVVIDAVTGDGASWVSLGVLIAVLLGLGAGVVHGVVQAFVALVAEPHRRTVASALAAGVSASLSTWQVRGGDVTVLEVFTWHVPYVVASAFLARWCHPVDQPPYG